MLPAIRTVAAVPTRPTRPLPGNSQLLYGRPRDRLISEIRAAGMLYGDAFPTLLPDFLLAFALFTSLCPRTYEREPDERLRGAAIGADLTDRLA